MTEPRFTIHPDVAAAHTLDKAFYLEDAAWALAREKVFARSWQWLGDSADVAVPGRLSPRELLPGLLDEPLLLARCEAGALRCLSNVCTHRGKVLVDQACAAADIRCAYHGRRFALNGRLRGMPGFEGVKDFPTPADDLPTLSFGEWGGQAFASLQPALPLADWLGEMPQRLAWLPVQHFAADASRARQYEFDAHWALYVENYLEGLHIPFVHPGLSQTLDMGAYHYEMGRASVLQLALARAGEAAFEPPPGSPEHGQRVAAYYWWLFPNLMLNFYPWGLSVNLVLPLSPSRTRVLFRSYVHDTAMLGQGAGGALDPVEMEDEAAVQSVQRGIRSRLYRHGRYSAKHEAGVHHFHRLLAEALAAP
jgi:choline monooxygenase